LAGSHYNRAWFVHNIFAEALERLFLTRFLVTIKPTIPEELKDLAAATTFANVTELLGQVNPFFERYESFRESARKGSIGKTAQYWLVYLDLMRYQIMAHTSVQENDFPSLMYCWKAFIPMYFMLNKLHYARYTIKRRRREIERGRETKERPGRSAQFTLTLS